MNLEEVEIAIIGAGPSGLIAAREASLRGVNVVVLEEHEKIGLPCHCAGLLSIKGLREINVPCEGTYRLSMVKGARFFSPSRLSFTVEWQEPIACVVNRRLFDAYLAEEASKGGSLIKLNSKVNRAKRDGDKWILTINSGNSLKAKMLIDAEGAVPRIPNMVGLKTHDGKRLLRGLQIDLSGVKADSEYVEVHLNNNLTPGFFAWVIPLNDETVRIGLACREPNIKVRLLKFIKERFGAEGDKLKVLKYYSGLIITCGPIKQTYNDGILVVGDSAGQVKPITGGGVIFGGICASIAGEIASKAIINNKIGKNFLKNYELKWRSKIGREIEAALLVRRILNRLSNKDLDKIFSTIIREEIYEDIIRSGDIDFHAATIVNVVKKKITRIMPIIFKVLFSSFIG